MATRSNCGSGIAARPEPVRGHADPRITGQVVAKHPRLKIIREVRDPAGALRPRTVGPRDPDRPARDGDHEIHVAAEVRRLADRMHREVEAGRIQADPPDQGVEKRSVFVHGAGSGPPSFRAGSQANPQQVNGT